MKRSIAALLLSVMFSSAVLAQTGAGLAANLSAPFSAGRLTYDITQVANRVQSEARTMQASPAQQRSWGARHAVLLGTLVGFGVGFAIGAATCRYPTAEGSSCSDWTYPGNARMLGGLTIGGFGAGIGAVVGWLGSR
jgi:hypothetical protein